MIIVRPWIMASVLVPRQIEEVRRKVAIFSKAWSVSMLVYIALASAVKKRAQVVSRVRAWSLELALKVKGAFQVGRELLADRLQLLIDPAAKAVGEAAGDRDDRVGLPGALVDQ